MKSVVFVLPLLTLAMAAKRPVRCGPQPTLTRAPDDMDCPNQPMCKCAAPTTKTVDCACPTNTIIIPECRTECECDDIATKFVHPTKKCGNECPKIPAITQAPEGMNCPGQPMCKCQAPVQVEIPCSCPTATATVATCRKDCGCDKIATKFVHGPVC